MKLEKTVVFLTLINLLQNTGVSQTGPFFPFEAERKGVPRIMLGFIIAQFSLVYIIASIATGKYLGQIGRPRGLRFGLYFVVVQLLILGAIYYIDNMYLFIFMAFFAQTLGGIGAGLNSTCAMAILTSCFPEEREDNIAILEAGVGIGMLLGPLAGALLYTVGGYIMPFWTVAFICIALYPTLTETINFIEQKEQEITAKQAESRKQLNETTDGMIDSESGESRPATKKDEVSVSFGKLCTVPMFVFGLICQIYVYGGIGFLSPTFSLHMVNSYEGFDEFWIGIYFAMPAVTYIINTPLVPTWCKYFGRKRTLLYGSVMFCLAVYMIGTSPLLHLPDSPRTIFFGVLLLGWSACMVTVPILPEMLAVIEHDLPELKGDELNNVASGYFNSFLGVGETVGPISASLLCEQFGFRTAFDIVACLILIYCICFLIYINESEVMQRVRLYIWQQTYGPVKGKPASKSAVKNDDVEIETAGSGLTNRKGHEKDSIRPTTKSKDT